MNLLRICWCFRRHRYLVKAVGFLFVWAVSLSAAASPKIAVSIAPIHSLVTGLMQGVGQPALILPSRRSPHGSGIPPSALRTLLSADLAIWVGPTLEGALAKGFSQRKMDENIQLLSNDIINRLPFRSQDIGEFVEDHDHDDDHDHEIEFDHDTDPHIWLSSDNAKAIVKIVAEKLIEIDPVNADIYQLNRKVLEEKIITQKIALQSRAAKLQGMRWLVLHDAYQYFENEFALQSVAAVTAEPEQKPGAKRIQYLRELIGKQGIQCVFSEPQMHSRVINILTEDNAINVAELDPVGFALEYGENLWFDLMDNLMTGFEHCLLANSE